MGVELDHVFLCCDPGAPEASYLAARGLVEGSPNTHPGQGTASRRFFFANAYLELFWVSDPTDAQREDVRPTRLCERWLQRAGGACPIGIVFRPQSAPIDEAPFPCWSYRPSYLPAGLSIEVGRDIPLDEPQLFYLPLLRTPNLIQRQPVTHPAGVDRITRVCVASPSVHEPSAALGSAVDAGLLCVRKAADHLLELGFAGQRATPLDLRPHLPLVFVPQANPG
jgi:hypothetical protein